MLIVVNDIKKIKHALILSKSIVLATAKKSDFKEKNRVVKTGVLVRI